MKTQVKREATKNIFGPYIFKIRMVPGCKQSDSSREKEKRLFQMIDDYIEQA